MVGSPAPATPPFRPSRRQVQTAEGHPRATDVINTNRFSGLLTGIRARRSLERYRSPAGTPLEPRGRPLLRRVGAGRPPGPGRAAASPVPRRGRPAPDRLPPTARRPDRRLAGSGARPRGTTAYAEFFTRANGERERRHDAPRPRPVRRPHPVARSGSAPAPESAHHPCTARLRTPRDPLDTRPDPLPAPRGATAPRGAGSPPALRAQTRVPDANRPFFVPGGSPDVRQPVHAPRGVPLRCFSASGGDPMPDEGCGRGR
ncbi:hypothetical protein M2167_004857 [Streptomyces sp. SPB4]|nr:hypothetical protein [Streptomyces sp. SPB4]